MSMTSTHYGASPASARLGDNVVRLLCIVLAGMSALLISPSLQAQGRCDPRWQAAPEYDQALAPLRHCYAQAARRLDDGGDAQAVGERVLASCAPETKLMVDHYVARADIIGVVIGRTPAEARATLLCHATGVVAWMRQNPTVPLPGKVVQPQLYEAAGTAPVHAISIGTTKRPQLVRLNAPGSVLLLLALEAPEWRLHWEPGQAPKRILVVTYVGKPTVILPPGGAGVNLVVTDMNHVDGPYGVRIDVPAADGFPYKHTAEALQRLNGYSLAFTGKVPTTQQLAYDPSVPFVVGR
jgi:hypothetical protein